MKAIFLRVLCAAALLSIPSSVFAKGLLATGAHVIDMKVGVVEPLDLELFLEGGTGPCAGESVRFAPDVYDIYLKDIYYAIMSQDPVDIYDNTSRGQRADCTNATYFGMSGTDSN